MCLKLVNQTRFQILFLSGLAFVIGLERTFRFFFQYHKIKGTSAFFGGILVVLFGYPLIGMIVEAYGFIVLFSGFFPVAVNFLRRIPILGSILNLPGISTVSHNKIFCIIKFVASQSSLKFCWIFVLFFSKIGSFLPQWSWRFKRTWLLRHF